MLVCLWLSLFKFRASPLTAVMLLSVYANVEMAIAWLSVVWPSTGGKNETKAVTF